MEAVYEVCVMYVSTYLSSLGILSGAVANGRAKFETPPKVSPEKPSRFFGSRSRTNSPMLPVKTPKVPASALKDLKNGNDDKKDSKDDPPNETVDPASRSTSGKTTSNSSTTPPINTQSKSPATSTLSSNKLLSKLRKK